jgi:formylglycine-generating enzyme required for sulfatase activity
MMGSSEDEEGRFNREGPRHRVQVPSFFMGRYPVTNAQYRKFLEANPKAAKPEYGSDREYNQPQQPVVGVSWEGARAYARWAGMRQPFDTVGQNAHATSAPLCHFPI